MFFSQHISYGFSKSIVILSTQTETTAVVFLVHSNLAMTFQHIKSFTSRQWWESCQTYGNTAIGVTTFHLKYLNCCYNYVLHFTYSLFPIPSDFFFLPYSAQISLPSSLLLFRFHLLPCISLLMGNSDSFVPPGSCFGHCGYKTIYSQNKQTNKLTSAT